ncbi:FimV/HubP family polar landmark protein [Stenotrophomonas sp. PS02298]|uniref:FimV/HubP family polar landmark protein n=1 Tax=Stenotrophomonas sp. PS02298 TaxID=2991424 RepID=UPI00249A18DE|nr:FimV/HubP family polar landmark protein [Stenotrophomonas sp. PS02298]
MRSLQGVLVLGLALFSSTAMALGLGNIRVLSKPGQPLLAEIPVITSDASELDNAKAGLASAATFERVGLAAPAGLVGELQFQFAQDRDGRAVIRVTSAAPVQVASVGFLIEVDWGQGRLVREYSALVAAPEAATAVAEPVIEAPAAAQSNLIVREPEPLPGLPAPAAPVAAPAPAQPVSAAPAARPAAMPVASSEGQLAPVQRGQSLSQIARELSRESGASLNQTMVALMRANPEAFIRGNINLLKQGAVLRTPAQEELARVDASEARAIVRDQAAQWRQARAPIPQPAVADAVVAPAKAAAPAANAGPSGARLEIAPAVAGAQQTAGMTTGLDAGGEGDMLANEQLQQAKEDLAARDAELQELRDRVGELEKLQKQQQSLIAMKDSDLAAAQQQLGEAAKRDGSSSFGWIWLGLALLVLGALGWLLSRRRKPLPVAPRADFEAGDLAAAMPVMGAAAAQQSLHAAEVDEFDPRDELDAQPLPVVAEVQPEAYEEPMPAWLKSTPPARVEPVLPVAAPAVAHKPVLLFEASRQFDAVVEPVPAQPEPAAADEAGWLAGDVAAVAPLAPAPAGRERLELAIAYLDLGDAETARTLLNEVAASADPQARSEALELLGRMA